MAADGQVTLGSEVLKASAKKLRRMLNGKIVAGFAGSTADAFSLFQRFETKLEQHNGILSRAVVELAKEWRTDRVLRHLEALLLVADIANTYIVSGNGDVIEPDRGAIHLGSHLLTALDARTLRRARGELQMVFQDPYGSLNPRMRAGDILAEPLMRSEEHTSELPSH